MKYAKKYLFLNLVLILAISLFGCGTTPVEETTTTIPVETVSVDTGNFTGSIILSGATKAKSSITVIPKIAGAEKITSISVKEGDRVSEGQILATLDQSIIKIQLDLAQITYDDALKNFERQKALYEAGALPAAAFEQVTSQLAQAESALTGQRIAFDNTLIKAPISGTVAALMGEVGALASAQSPLAQIANIDTLEVQAMINEMQVNKIKAGEEVEVMIPALDKELFKGIIASVSPVMVDQVKAYPVTITIDNKEQKIKAGMYAELEIITDVEEDVVIIPAQGVLIRDGETSVYLVEDGKALKRQIVTGSTNGQVTVVLEGLEIGEEVIIRGNDNVVTGDLVSVVNRSEQ